MAQYLNVDPELRLPGAEPVGGDLPERARIWLATALPGTRLLSASWLTGGIDHANHAVAVVDRAGRESRYVLRRWVRPDWREKDPDYTVERERSALELLERVGAPTPRLVATDATGDVCDQPALLMTWLPGAAPPQSLLASDVELFVAELAAAAEQIHAVDADGAGIAAYEPYHDLFNREIPADAVDRKAWVRALEYLSGTPDPDGATFIHRDYHPYNVLWHGHRVAAVIDWSNASIGHADQDVAHMRWNLAVSYGYDIAERFRLAVRDRGGREYDRHWDARVIVDLIPSLRPGEPIGPDLPELGRTVAPHGDVANRIAALERLLREALP